MDIAAFIMLGDTELTVAAAGELLKKCPDFDILLTAEAKGIPLAPRDEPPERQALRLRPQERQAVYEGPGHRRGPVHHHRGQTEAGHRPQRAGGDERQAGAGGG